MNTSQPLVSVIMPTFNDGKFLAEAIDSILAQSYKTFELIIINDGCTDNTEDIIRNYNDNRIRYIVNSKNRGYIYSLNKGLTHAKGTYIARMDADDRCPPERLKKQIEFLEQNKDIGVLGGNMISFKENGEIQYHPFPEKHDAIRARLIFRNPMAHPTVMLRKAIIQKHNIRYNDSYYAAEDFKLWQQLIKYTKFHNLQETLLYYRIHAGNVSILKQNAQNKTKIKIISENFQQIAYHAKPADIKLFTDIVNTRYDSTHHIKDIIKICQYLTKHALATAEIESSALKIEIGNLIKDHLTHKRKYYPSEWRTLLINNSLIQISLKYYIKTIIRSFTKI